MYDVMLCRFPLIPVIYIQAVRAGYSTLRIYTMDRCVRAGNCVFLNVKFAVYTTVDAVL